MFQRATSYGYYLSIAIGIFQHSLLCDYISSISTFCGGNMCSSLESEPKIIITH